MSHPRCRVRLFRFPHEALALVAGIAAACASEQGAPASRVTRGEDQELRRGSVAPESARIAQDVRWLADDAREGRRAGTSGERESARWLAERLEALGLEPAGSEGFFQGFEVPLPVRDGSGSRIQVPAESLELDGLPAEEGAPRELVPLFCSAGAEVRGPLVFAGYGISSAELGRDDYAGLACDEAIVLLVRGTPPASLLAGEGMPENAGDPAGNPHGAAQPAAAGWGSTGAVFHKVMEAKRRGAAAVIVAQHPGRDEPMLAFSAGGSAEAKIPALHVSAALAERLWPGYAEEVTRLDGGAALSGTAGAPRALVLRADVVRERGEARNVLGRIRGEDPARTLVIGAHFDHLGLGGPGSLAPEAAGEIHNGADDNASGTATVVEIARCLAAGPRPSCDVVVALWSGEELGLLGSEHWARAPTFALESVIANLNLDMVGRAGSGKLSVLGAGSAREFERCLERAGRAAELELEVSLSGQGVGGSDHQTFLKREIPALHLFSGLHADYHRPSDDFERVEAGGAARVASLALELVHELGSTPRLAWVPPAAGDAPAPGGGFRTRFGSIPDYAYDGPGFRLDGTSPGGPAEKAGLLRGDVIVSIDDQPLDGLGDFMFVLNTHKPGDVLRVRFLREGEEESCQVTLESNQVE